LKPSYLKYEHSSGAGTVAGAMSLADAMQIRTFWS